MSKKNIFENQAFEDFNQWVSLDKKLYLKIVNLIRDIDRFPFSCLGKHEPLKHELSGYWSRRINDEHRFVYKVTEEEIIIIACKYHYSD